MARTRRSTWERRVAECEGSSLTQSEFARQHGLKLRTLRSWIYRLRREAPETRLLPVRVTAATRADVEIVLPSGVVVRVAAGTAADDVAALVRALT